MMDVDGVKQYVYLNKDFGVYYFTPKYWDNDTDTWDTTWDYRSDYVSSSVGGGTYCYYAKELGDYNNDNFADIYQGENQDGAMYFLKSSYKWTISRPSATIFVGVNGFSL